MGIFAPLTLNNTLDQGKILNDSGKVTAVSESDREKKSNPKNAEPGADAAGSNPTAPPQVNLGSEDTLVSPVDDRTVVSQNSPGASNKGAATKTEVIYDRTVVNPNVGSGSDRKFLPNNRYNLSDLLAADPGLNERYEILEMIGTGGMGGIYKARDRRLKKIVAIKVIHAGLFSSDADMKSALSRFMTEGQAASMLDDPAIVSVHLIDLIASGLPYMVMDFVDGITLAQYLKTHGSLTQDHFREIFRVVCDAISHAHARKVLHRDIKPSNIMLSGEGAEQVVRILDFGIAKILDENAFDTPSLTRTGEALGSPSYMSPEQINGKGVDERSDIYSLGCTMYECLTGCPPFIGATSFEIMSMHMNLEPPKMADASLGKYLPDELETLVMRCLEKDPAKRFQTINDVRTAIIASAKTREFEIPSPVLKHQSRQPKIEKSGPIKGAGTKSQKTMRWTIVGLLVLIAIIACVTLSQMMTKQSPSLSNAKNTKQTITKPSNSNDLNEETGFGLEDSIGSLLAKSVKEHPDTVHLDNEANVVDFTADDMEALRKLPMTVTNVALRFNGFNNEGLAAVAHLPIQKLDIDSSSVSDLSPIRSKSTIEVLSMARTPIKSDAIEVIKSLPHLKNLDIHSTDLTGADIAKLQTQKSLRRVYLPNEGRVTFKDAIALQRSLPGAVVEFSTTRFQDFEKAFPLMKQLQAAIEQARDQDVIGLCKQQLTELQKYHGDDAPILKALCYKATGDALIRQGKLEEGFKSVSEADRLITDQYYDDASLLPYLRDEEAAVLERSDDPEKARQALEIRKKIAKTLEIIDPQLDSKDPERILLTARNHIGYELDSERTGAISTVADESRSAIFVLDRLADSDEKRRLKAKALLIRANTAIDQLRISDQKNVSNRSNYETTRYEAVIVAHEAWSSATKNIFYKLAADLETKNPQINNLRKQIYAESEKFDPTGKPPSERQQ